jgi:hypothetical protein
MWKNETQMWNANSMVLSLVFPNLIGYIHQQKFHRFQYETLLSQFHGTMINYGYIFLEFCDVPQTNSPSSNKATITTPKFL